MSIGLLSTSEIFGHAEDRSIIKANAIVVIIDFSWSF
jgi:hypothetical protein